LNQQRFGVAKKMQSDCATGENKKPSGVPRRRSLLRVALLNVEDVAQMIFSSRKIPAATRQAQNEIDASVAVGKFARVLSLLRSDLPNQSGAGKPMILVSLLNPKSANVPAEQSRELRIRDTGVRRERARHQSHGSILTRSFVGIAWRRSVPIELW
jgi:hypothetical protein